MVELIKTLGRAATEHGQVLAELEESSPFH